MSDNKLNTINMEVHITPSIKEKIDSGELILKGNQVRDRKGRIVCNLDAITTPRHQYFSPNILIYINGDVLISESAISSKLEEHLKEENKRLSVINEKLDRILKDNINNLSSEVELFNELFNQLEEGSNLTSAETVFTAGAKAASRLAAHINDSINDYLNKTELKYHNTSELYSDFKSKGFKEILIKETKFAPYKNSTASFFALSFINLLNKINILSLCFNGKSYSRFEVNLTTLKKQLHSLLSKLITGLGSEGDIYEMLYSYKSETPEFLHPKKINIKNNKQVHNPNISIEMLLKHDNVHIDELVTYNFEKETLPLYDENRVDSIVAIISQIDEINNLLKRNEQFTSISTSTQADLPELVELKKIVFN